MNVLIALMDTSQVHHRAAHRWFDAVGKNSWATCPMTQNAVLRILGQSRYPNSPGPPDAILPVLRTLL